MRPLLNSIVALFAIMASIYALYNIITWQGNSIDFLITSISVKMLMELKYGKDSPI